MKRHGFTLIELMIVVVIIGILATLAVPNFMRMRDNSLEAKVKSNAHTVQLAAEDYAVRHDGVYSVAGADIQPLMPGGALVENAFTRAFTEPQFGAAAVTPGQIGLVSIEHDGQSVGYVVTGFGKSEVVITLFNGS